MILSWFENGEENFKGLQLLSFNLLIDSIKFERYQISYEKIEEASQNKTIIEEIMEFVPIMVLHKKTSLESKNFSIDVQPMDKNLLSKIEKSIDGGGIIMKFQIIALKGRNLCKVFIQH